MLFQLIDMNSLGLYIKKEYLGKVNSMSIVSPRNRIICRKFLLSSFKAAVTRKRFNECFFLFVTNYNNHQDLNVIHPHIVHNSCSGNLKFDSRFFRFIYYSTARWNDGEGLRYIFTWNFEEVHYDQTLS